MNSIEGLFLLAATCEYCDIRLEIEYDTGRTVSGEWMGKPDEAKHVEQGPSGWRVTVDQEMYIDNETGLDKLFPSIGQAASAGLAILREAIKEREKNGTLRTKGKKKPNV